MRATWLVDQLRAQGAKTTTHTGNWVHVGGELSGIRGWFLHHTASGPSSDGAPDINYIWNTGSLVPEYNAYCQRSGLITVGCGGRANHAGKGGDTGNSDSGRKPIPWIPPNGANSYTVCLALANNGVGEPYTKAQQDAAIMFARAVNAGAGCPNDQGLSHFEWTRRKIDPAGQSYWASGASSWDMDAFRQSVVATQPAPEPITPPGEDDDMPPAPATVALGEQVFVFARGPDRCLWWSWSSDPINGEHGWASVGGSLASGPSAAVIAGYDQILVTATGDDNAVWGIIRYPDGTFSGWFPYGGNVG